MPDPTPEQQQAQENMRQWMERHQPVLHVPGPFGAVVQAGATIENLIAAAGAGELAVAPDLGEAINKRLTDVQDQVSKLTFVARQAATDPRFGGGYAEQVSQFVQRVAAGEAGSAEEILSKFRDELEQLKAAVATSIGSYHATDSGSASNISNAGGQR